MSKRSKISATSVSHLLASAGRSGLVVAWMAAVWEAAVFITTATAMYSLGHGLRTLPVVPLLTEPSTIRGMVKWVSEYQLSGWVIITMVMMGVDGSSQVGWLGLRVGGHPALSLHSSNEPSELSQWLWSWLIPTGFVREQIEDRGETS